MGKARAGVIALFSIVFVGSTARAATLCDVTAFGARGDDHTSNTVSIQRAIDACAVRGGGTVVVPPGRFRSGTILLKSHIVLKLEPGAVLTGSRDVADYLPGSAVGLGTTLGVDVAGEGKLAGLIVARNVTDVSIVGPGTIDGDGDSFMSGEPHIAHDFEAGSTRNPAGSTAAVHDLRYGPLEVKPSGRPGVLVLFFHATDVRVRDVTFANSPNWTLVMQDVTRGSFTGFSILNSPLIPNNDGVDCNRCHDVHFSDATIRAGDDDFAISEAEDVTITNVSMSSRSAAIRVEATQRAAFTNLTIDSNRGLALFASTKLTRPTDGIVFSNVIMRTRLIPGHWWGKGEPIYASVQRCPATGCAGGIRNVTLSNIDADAEAGAVIVGAPGLPIEGLTLSNVRFRIRAPNSQFAAQVGGNFDRRWTAPTPAEGIVKHDIPAVFLGDVKRTTLRDVEVDWLGAQPDYTTEAVAAERYDDLVIDGLAERGSPPPRASSIALLGGTGARIERHRPAVGRPAIVGDAVTVR